MPKLNYDLVSTTKEDLFKEIPDSLLLEFLQHWIPSEIGLTKKQKIVCIKQANLNKVFSVEPIGSNDASIHLKHVETKIPSYGLKTRYLSSGGRKYENNESVRGNGILFINRYAHLEQPKVLESALFLQYPYLINYKPKIYSINKIDEYIYISLEQQLYVPVLAIVERNPDLIVKACKKSYAIWPKAGIWDGKEKFAEIEKFLDLVKG